VVIEVPVVRGGRAPRLTVQLDVPVGQGRDLHDGVDRPSGLEAELAAHLEP